MSKRPRLLTKYLVVVYGNHTSEHAEFNTLRECHRYAKDRGTPFYEVFSSLKKIKERWREIYYTTGNPSSLRKELAYIIGYYDENFFKK